MSGYPFDEAVQVALHTTIDFLAQHERPAKVVSVVFAIEHHDGYRHALIVRDENYRWHHSSVHLYTKSLIAHLRMRAIGYEPYTAFRNASVALSAMQEQFSGRPKRS